MSDLGVYQNNINELPTLDNLRYENIFKVYQNADGNYFYNILNTVTFGDISNSDLYTTIVVNERMPWPIISFRAYDTIELWWLIALINNVRNPLELPVGNKIKILKPQYIGPVISQITQLLS